MFFSNSWLGSSNNTDRISRQIAAERVIQFNAGQRLEKHQRRVEKSKTLKERLINSLKNGKLRAEASWSNIFISVELTTNDKLIVFLHSLLHNDIKHSPRLLNWLGVNYKDNLYTLITKCRQNREEISKNRLDTLMSDSLKLEHGKPITPLGIIWHTQRGLVKCRPNSGILKKVAADLVPNQASTSMSMY